VRFCGCASGKCFFFFLVLVFGAHFWFLVFPFPLDFCGWVEEAADAGPGAPPPPGGGGGGGGGGVGSVTILVDADSLRSRGL